MKIVGLVGPKRSGKDTAAAALVEQRGFVRIGFADQVKDLALRINPIVSVTELLSGGNVNIRWLREVVRDEGWESAKARATVRRFLQELGTGVRDSVGEDSWVNAWAIALTSGRHCPPEAVVVPDVRFLNEADALRGRQADWEAGLSARYDQALLIRIVRPGLDLSDTHVSETEQLGITCDVELTNDSTPEALHAKVLAVYDEWVNPRVRCTRGIYNPLSLGPPEQCAYDDGHEGECEP